MLHLHDTTNICDFLRYADASYDEPGTYHYPSATYHNIPHQGRIGSVGLCVVIKVGCHNSDYRTQHLPCDMGAPGSKIEVLV